MPSNAPAYHTAAEELAAGPISRGIRAGAARNCMLGMIATRHAGSVACSSGSMNADPIVSDPTMCLAAADERRII